MPKRFTVATGVSVAQGDAVCLGNSTANQVRKAVPAALANARTVLGVARRVLPNGDVLVNTVGEVVESAITGLGPGVSNLVAVDTNAKLVRVPKPDGSEYVIGTCDAQGHVCIQARASRDVSAQHVFNVKNYGAKGDGMTNDSPAFLAVQQAIASLVPGSQASEEIEVPPGNYFLADGLDILISAHFKSKGHRSGTARATLTLAAGKNIRFWKFHASPTHVGDGADARFEGFKIVCTLDTYLRWPGSGGAVTAGQKFRVRSGAVDEVGKGSGEWIVYYEALNSGIVGTGAEPDFWNTTQTPAFSRGVWQRGTDYKFGSIVRGTDPTHWDIFFVAVVPDAPPYTARSGGTEPAWNFTADPTNTGAFDVVDGGITWRPKSSSSSFIKHGSVWFEVKTAAAFWVTTQCNIANCYILAPLGPCVHMFGNIPSTPLTGCSDSIVEDNIFELQRSADPDGGWWSGVGLAITGGDASACKFSRNIVTGGNVVHPFRLNGTAYSVGDIVQFQAARGVQKLINFKCTVAERAAGSEPIATYTLGATFTDGGVTWQAVTCPPEYGFYDRGFLGNRHYHNFTQECAGPGFALLSGAGAGGTYGCYSENFVPDVYHGHNGLYGGNATSGTVPYMSFSFDPQGGYNIREKRSANYPLPATAVDTDIEFRLNVTGGAQMQVAYIFPTDDGQGWGYLYNDAGSLQGWLTHAHASSRASHAISGCRAKISTKPLGAGILRIPRLLMWGDADDGFFEFAQPLATEDRLVLGGKRRVGDRRRKLSTAAILGAYIDEVCTVEGFDAPLWTPLYANMAEVVDRPGAQPAMIVRPTSSANPNRFKCVVGGTSGNMEPNWATAPNVGNQLTDGPEVTWENVGTAPTWSECNEVRDPAVSTVTQPRSLWSGGTSSDGTPLPKVDSVRDSKTTTNNTTITASSFTIPANTAAKFDVTVTSMQDDGTDMAWFVLRGLWRRDGTAAPVQHRAPEVVDSQVNATGMAWTAVLDVSGNDVRVRVTGDTGKNIRWGLIWQPQMMEAP